MTSYDWPGNVRQLENTVERLVILCRNGAIGVQDLPPEILGGSPFPGPGVDAAPASVESAGAQVVPERARHRKRGYSQCALAIRRQCRSCCQYLGAWSGHRLSQAEAAMGFGSIANNVERVTIFRGMCPWSSTQSAESACPYPNVDGEPSKERSAHNGCRDHIGRSPGKAGEFGEV